MLQDIDTVPL